jgi:hypothetical protein
VKEDSLYKKGELQSTFARQLMIFHDKLLITMWDRIITQAALISTQILYFLRLSRDGAKVAQPFIAKN